MTMALSHHVVTHEDAAVSGYGTQARKRVRALRVLGFSRHGHREMSERRASDANEGTSVSRGLELVA